MALQNTNPWVVDSGASTHMTSTDGILHTRLPPSHSFITVGNGHNLPVSCRGTSSLDTSASQFTLNNVLVVPSLVQNLLSVRQFTRDNNCSIEFDALGFSVKDIPTRRVILRCNSSGDLYTITPDAATATTHANLAVSSTIWHHRLGHPGHATIDILRNNSSITCNKVVHKLCHSCQLGKHVRLPFSSSTSYSTTPFEIVHCDVWMSPVASISGSRYYLVILDNFSHFCWTFPLAHKSEVHKHITHFCNFVQTQFGLSVKSIQADNGTEFVNRTLTDLFSARGIHLRLSCPYTSPQNGKAERILRTLNNICRTLLIHAHMPASYWAEALATATYLLNRRPCSAVHNSVPYNILYQATPDYSHLRVFGCLCYPNMSSTSQHKLAPRSTACVFLGYPSSHKGYRCLDLSTRRIIISHHVVFDESCFPFSSTRSDPLSSLDFLLAEHAEPVPRRTAAAATPYTVAPSSSDVEQPRSTPAGLDDDFDDPAVLLRGPVLAAPDRPSSAAPRSIPAAAAQVPAPAASAAPVPATPAASPQAVAQAPAAAPPPPGRLIQHVYSRRSRPPPATPTPSPAQAPASSPQAPAQVPPPPRGPVTRSQTGTLRTVHPMNLSATHSSISPIPANYRSGLADPNWRAAMADEYKALIDNGT